MPKFKKALIHNLIILFSAMAHFPVLAAIEATPGKTLEECFQASLIRSEDLANQEELIAQAEERVRQAWGSILPTINASYVQLFQATPSSSSGASIFPAKQTTTRLSASQPLFQGFREFNGLKQVKRNAAAAEQSKNYAKLLLFQDVATGFYQVLANEADTRNIKNEIALNHARLIETNHFRKIGRSREVDVLTLKSNIAALEADLVNSEARLRNARTTLAFLTGLPETTPIEDSEPLPTSVLTLEEYLTRIDQRPDVLSQTNLMEGADAGMSFAKGAHLPTVSLSGNYYFARPGVLSDVNWDVQLGISLPLFQGGVLQSQIRTAASVFKQSELALSKVKRVAKQQIESAFLLYQGDASQVDRLKNALTLSQKTYELEMIYYRRGLVTQLEVLQSLSAYQTNQRSLDRAFFQMKTDYLKLQAAAAYRPRLTPDGKN